MVNGLYMRISPSTKAKIILLLKQNQVVTIVSQQGSWYQVEAGSKIGYAYSKYIKIQ